MPPVDDTSAVALILVSVGVGIFLLARGLLWLGNRASNWDGDIDR